MLQAGDQNWAQAGPVKTKCAVRLKELRASTRSSGFQENKVRPKGPFKLVQPFFNKKGSNVLSEIGQPVEHWVSTLYIALTQLLTK